MNTKTITRIKRLALALCFATPLVSRADAEPITAVNPVTGATETYIYKYVGSGDWTVADWQNASGVAPAAVPQVAAAQDGDPTCYDSLLVEGEQSLSASIEGWTFNIGLFDGAQLTVPTLTKWQGGCSACVGSGSKLTISALGSGNSGNNINFYVAAQDGIAYECAYGKGGNFYYYFTGEGSVSYQALTGGSHAIKQADVTLSGNAKSVQSKTLVSFGEGTTVAFTADAIIKVKNGEGTVVREIALSSIVDGEATLTTDGKVGDCQLVKTANGIDLYYVDGDPAVIPSYYPNAISINFTHNGNGIDTMQEVGLAGYAVPGTQWVNLPGANTETTVEEVTTVTPVEIGNGVTVAVTGSRGSYDCWNLPAATDLRNGYIDENAGNPTPTVTVSGVPYDNYRVIVYHATDSANVQFGYDTINGVDYTYVNGSQAVGTTSWGNSGANGSAAPVEEGVNTLVSGILSGSEVTFVAHRQAPARGCFAAIQIVEVAVSETDLIIPVDGDTEYPVSEALTPENVFVTGSGTLTFTGEGSITAGRLEIDAGVTVNMSGITATTAAGNGTAIYSGELPTANVFTSSDWRGTVWINGKSGVTGFNVNSYGNANSAVKISGVDGWISAPFDNTVPVILENGEFDYALKLTNGNSPSTDFPNRCTTFVKLSGSGTLTEALGNPTPMLKIYDATEFTGAITVTKARIVFAAADSTTLPTPYYTSIPQGSVYVDAGTSVTVPADTTWTANGGFVVNGTLVVNGALASSAAAATTGSGTVVFVGNEPTTGNAWWKNAAWTGTVEIRGATLAKNINLADYGNSESKVCMNGTTAYVAAVALGGNHNVKELVIGANGFTQNGYYSSGAVSIVLPCKLTGTGTYSLTATGNATKTVSIGDASEFDGTLNPAGNNCRFVIGETSREVVAGSVVVGSGKALKIASGNASYSGGLFIDEGGQATITGFLWMGAGITVDGTLTVSSRVSKIGGGTPIALGDTGILEITESGNVETADSYNLVTGTGSIKFSGDGFYVLNGNYPSALALINEKGAALVVPTTGATIGSLSGTKGFRSDWAATPAEGRYLTIKQAKDTEWSGSINQTAEHRLTGVVVDPGESTTGTLKITGTQTASSTLTVNGSVNLEGTWVGDATVAGAFGGRGTLTGNLTFAEGSTFKVWETDSNGLSVSGTINYPETGKVTVDVSDIVTTGGTLTILTAGNVDGDKFELAAGTSDEFALAVEEGKLVLTAPAAVGAIAPTDNPAAYTIYQTADQVVAALAQLSGMQTLMVTGAFAADSVTVQSGLTLTVSVMGGSVSVGTFNVAGSLNLTRDSVSSTAVVLTDAAASCTVNSTLVESVTVTSGVQGKNVSTSEDTNPVYTLVDAPAYPSYITPEKQAKYTEWATYADVTATEAESLEEAYLLNCLPEEVDAAKAAFVFTAIYQDSEGNWVTPTTTSYNTREYNGEVTVTRYSDVGCTTESETGTFFRASLR